jgi:YegS/Rv2252/BmrU family lipid kinase
MVLAWGGDGTINEVASGIAFSDVWLGIVPGGSGNGLARELGVPLDPARALELAATGHTRVIDAGQIDEALFFNVAGIGLDAEIARRIAEPGSRRGLAGYVQTTLATLVRYRSECLTIQASGASTRRRVLFVAVANSRQYGNGARIAPAARLDDGRLDLVVVEAQSAWRLMARLPAFFGGTLTAGAGLHMSQVDEAVISGDGPLCFHVDGEPYLGDDDVHVRARPRALRIRTP